MITRPAIFKWRQTEPGLILCAVRWYLRYSLSLRDIEELLEERGLNVDHTTSGAGCSVTALSWSSDCDSISSRQTSRGESAETMAEVRAGRNRRRPDTRSISGQPRAQRRCRERFLAGRHTRKAPRYPQAPTLQDRIPQSARSRSRTS